MIESETDGGREVSVDKITLKCGTNREVETAPWDQLPTRHLEFEGFDETFPCAESIAFLDTNTLTEECHRKIFVVRVEGEDVIYLFTEDGSPLDEPENGVANGQQPISGEEDAFLSDWQGGYYQCFVRNDERVGDGVGQDLRNPDFREGVRIAISFGEPDAEEGAAWYGGQIIEQCDSLYTIAFDDGDIKFVSHPHLVQKWNDKCLRFPTIEQGGIIENATGCSMVVGVARSKCGKAPQPAIMGVIVGATGHMLGDDPIYESFHRHVAACEYDEEAAGDARKTRHGGVVAKAVGRGFHTFRRGDICKAVRDSVHFPKGEDDDESCLAHVFGLTVGSDGAGNKYLVLQEKKSDVFFVSLWTHWQRVHSDPGCADVDDDDTACVLDVDDVKKMVADFEASMKLVHLNNKSKVHSAARHVGDSGPPAFEHEAKERLKKQKACERRERQAQLAKQKRDEAIEKKRQEVQHLEKQAQLAKRKRESPAPKEQRLGKQLPTPPNLITLQHSDDSDEEAVPLSERRRATSRAAANAQVAAARSARPTGGGSAAMLPASARKGATPVASPVLGAPLSPVPPPPAQIQTLPAGWKVAYDQNRGQPYYYNKALNLCQYEPPVAQTLPEIEQAPSPPPPPPQPRVQHNKAAVTAIDASSASTSSASLSISTHPAGAPATQLSMMAMPYLANAYQPFFARQRLDRIAQLRAMLMYATDPAQKMELAGELAVLESRPDCM